jgi:biopolymer transport protein ExbD
MNAELLDSPPPGSIAACHKAGCIQKDGFMHRFKHFVRFMKTSTQDPVILTLDDHYSHSRNIEVIDSARENGVHIVCVPLHGTHKLNTLGVSLI